MIKNITIPKNVKITINDLIISCEGPLGTLNLEIPKNSKHLLDTFKGFSNNSSLDKNKIFSNGKILLHFTICSMYIPDNK